MSDQEVNSCEVCSAKVEAPFIRCLKCYRMYGMSEVAAFGEGSDNE